MLPNFFFFASGPELLAKWDMEKIENLGTYTE